MSALVARLLSHYWTADDHPATRQAQIEDWIDDLREFPLGAIDGACQTWRQSQSRRPTIADIRKLILPQPTPDREAAAAYAILPNSRLSLDQRRKHRNAIEPMWSLVRRAMAGENPNLLIAERQRMTEEIFQHNPELHSINATIETEKSHEP